ncbi:MAG: NifB/NifX family molybdenum-iron cluster-binding protein [Campylobacterota bacterium]|nr:NifB/NifX family molybdenum-iron cluster-binding protein [Campylobacterota bacterium]
MQWLLTLLFVTGSLFAEVVVIASEGENVKASVSGDASRCDYYIVTDSEGAVLKSMKNPHQNVGGGASSHLVKLLHAEKASHFIAAGVGMKLENALIADKIDYTIFDGSVENAIKEYKSR